MFPKCYATDGLQNIYTIDGYIFNNTNNTNGMQMVIRYDKDGYVLQTDAPQMAMPPNDTDGYVTDGYLL